MSKKLTTEIFIERGIKIHGDKYGYHESVYVTAKISVKIYCNTCKKFFWQTPDHHINRKRGCRVCGNKQHGLDSRLSLKEIIERCSEANDYKYSYSITIYVKYHDNMKYICPVHGIVEQKLSQHITGIGCKECGLDKKSKLFRFSDSEIIDQLSKIYNMNNYIIDLSTYKNSSSKLNIKCNLCGHEFYNNFHNFKNGAGCPNCQRKNITWTPEKLLQKSKEMYKNLYTYIDINIKTIKDTITLQCNNCGHIFTITADSHINNKNVKAKGCCKCGGGYTTEEFIVLAKKKNIYYDYCKYDKVDYKHSNIHVKIYCTFCNTYFYMKPRNHLAGYGCNNCNKSSKGELKINTILSKNNIDFKSQHCFPGCKFKHTLRFDFYLPQLNVCIEYDGEQHYKPVEYFGGEKQFKENKIKDEIKNQYCADNNIDLIRIPYWNFKNIESILTEQLL